MNERDRSHSRRSGLRLLLVSAVLAIFLFVGGYLASKQKLRLGITITSNSRFDYLLKTYEKAKATAPRGAEFSDLMVEASALPVGTFTKDRIYEMAGAPDRTLRGSGREVLFYKFTTREGAACYALVELDSRQIVDGIGFNDVAIVDKAHPPATTQVSREP
jgi:hypothetical protein